MYKYLQQEISTLLHKIGNIYKKTVIPSFPFILHELLKHCSVMFKHQLCRQEVQLGIGAHQFIRNTITA